MTNSRVNLSGRYQKITRKNNDYIENEIYFNRIITPKLLSEVKFFLPNLLNFEIQEDRAVLTTPIIIGTPLKDYIPANSGEKIELINKYLEMISKFQTLPIFMQINLIRLENFYIVEGELTHRGILIIEDLDYNNHFDRSYLLKTIKNVADNIIKDDVTLYNFKNYFRDLPNFNIRKYSVISEDIKKIYIKDLFVDSTFDTEAETVKTKWWKHFNIKFATITLFFVFLLATASFSLIQSLGNNTSNDVFIDFKIEREGDNFIFIDDVYSFNEVEVVEKYWTVKKNSKTILESDKSPLSFKPTLEGNYTISLRVKTKDGKWSKNVQKNISKSDTNLILDDMELFDIDDVVWNEELANSGNKSILLSNENNSIEINSSRLIGNVTLKAMLNSKNNENIKVKVEGISDGDVSWSKEQEIKLSPDAWVPFQITSTSDEIDSINISFVNMKDSLSFDTLVLYSNNVDVD